MGKAARTMIACGLLFGVARYTGGQKVADAPQQLINEIIWSVGHEGCDVYQGNQLRSGEDLRECFASHQKTADDRSLIESASAGQIVALTLSSLPRVWDEYKTADNFAWVMDHEGQGPTIRRLLTENRYEDIRAIYVNYQSHNEFAVHALSGLSDDQLSSLIEHGVISADAVNSSSESLLPLRDHIMWIVTRDGCSLFDREELLPAKALRGCFLRTEIQNRNGEAAGFFRSASDPEIQLASRRAITEIKRDYDVSQTVGNFLFYTQQIDRFKQLATVGGMPEVRSLLASFDPIVKDTPHLWNALADSEIAEIVNRPRFDVIIPRGASEAAVEWLLSLLDVRPFAVSDQTTISTLANSVCPISDSSRPSAQCESIVRNLVVHQGGQIEPDGHIAGKAVIDLPSIPREGVASLLTFRPDTSPQTLRINPETSQFRFEAPVKASLIESGAPTTLSPATIQKYGDSGLRWYAYYISADKILSSDVTMTADPVRVGIIDSGVDVEQPMLKPFFWKTTQVYRNWAAGSIGYSYLSKISDPTEDYIPHINCHGTHVTGLVTMRELESWFPQIKAMSLAAHIRVYSLKIAGLSEVFSDKPLEVADSAFASNALYDGVKSDIHLFNMSIRGPESESLQDQIAATKDNALIVSAAGNDTLDLDLPKHMAYDGSLRDPASHLPYPNVLFVASLNDQYDLNSDSNHGDHTVEIAAPGSNILSTVHSLPSDPDVCSHLSGNSLLGLKDGTSQAAPLVTATAAILLAENPTARPTQIKERILATCDQTPSLTSAKSVKNGCRLNMAQAIISTSDLVELASGTWLRGAIDRNSIKLTANDGTSIDISGLIRVSLLDQSGNATVYITGGELSPAQLAGPSVIVELNEGQVCPSGSSVPCQIPSSTVKDIVFRWHAVPTAP